MAPTTQGGDDRRQPFYLHVPCCWHHLSVKHNNGTWMLLFGWGNECSCRVSQWSNRSATWQLFPSCNTVLALREITQAVCFLHSECPVCFVLKSSVWCLLLESHRSLMARVLKGMKIKLEISSILALSKTHTLFRNIALNNIQNTQEGCNLTHS